ncbi:hypothetical protein KR51_00037410, partial [Rubidibacter lacunae KORDI 51-2]
MDGAVAHLVNDGEDALLEFVNGATAPGLAFRREAPR